MPVAGWTSLFKAGPGRLFRFGALLRRRGGAVLDTQGCDCLILANGSNASITYFIDPWLAVQGRRATLVDTGRQRPAEIPYPACATLVIARYLPREWTGAVARFHAAGGRVVYFMDDDLMDPRATASLPRDYARRIAREATAQRSFIEAHCDEFLVSSPYLAHKYAGWSPCVLPPHPGAADDMSGAPVSVCYHGTASHQEELAWLVDIMGQVLARAPHVRFEVFGNHAVNRAYRNLPRVAVLHPMSWSNYRAYTAAVRHDIALAPLLPGPFNAGRGPTKFFDFARMGAVGIYTDTAPYQGFVRPDQDGLLLPNEPARWVETIVALAGDPATRVRLKQGAAQRVRALQARRGDGSATPADEAGKEHGQEQQ